jgi:hypothetical protein
MGEYLKLYGPACANLVVTIGSYFLLKKKIAEAGLDHTDILKRLDRIDAAMQQIIPVIQHHDKIIKSLTGGTTQEASEETEPPKSEEKDTTVSTAPKAKKTSSPPKVKAKTNAKNIPPPKTKDQPKIEKVTEQEIKTEEIDIDDDLDAILAEDESEFFDIEVDDSENEQKKPPKKTSKSYKKKSD